jgi:hypothetical protein
MKIVVEYQAVSEAGDVKKLNRAVKRLLDLGFQPLGPVSTTIDSDCIYFTQAMVKYGESKKEATRLDARFSKSA